MTDPGFDLRAYEPPISLWELVEQHVPAHEHEELRSMLGHSMIDQSLELHQEIETLLDIWKDYRDETEDSRGNWPKLPEPPGLRNRLIQEIQFFVDNVKEKAKNQGINADKLFQMRHNMEVIDYAMDTVRPASRSTPRPSTARSTDGRETPMISTPTGSDRMSAASTLSEDLETMNDKLNFLQFDEVVQHLRNTLEEEIETLERDIRFLYECLDEEADFRAEMQGTISREPTIAELQQERSKMEKELLSETMNRTVPPQIKPAFSIQPNRKLPPAGDAKVRSLGPVNAGSVSTGAPNSPKGSRTGQEKLHSPKTAKKSESLQCHRDTVKGNERGAASSPTAKSGPLKATHNIVTLDNSNGSRVKSNSPTDTRDNSNQQRPRVRHRTNSPARNNLVTVDMASNDKRSASPETRLLPTPPSSARSQGPRPSSAQRFRSMVIQTRESSE